MTKAQLGKHVVWDKVFNYISSIDNWDDGTKYAIDVVIKESILTSKMIFYACLRHLLFLYRSHTEESFPFFYDPTLGKKIDNFVKHVIVPEIRAPFINPPFRQFQSYFTFGWKYRNDPTELITKDIFDIEARKQWKSSYWAMIMLVVSLGILGDGAPVIFTCGPQRETSKIPYNTAGNYIRYSPDIQSFFLKNNTLSIQSNEGGIIKHLSFERSALEGQNPSMIILTEYHLHPDNTMEQSARYSKNASRKNRLIIFDTTKGDDVNGVCFNKERAYKRFLDEQILNPMQVHKNYSIFLFCAELDLEDYDNWEDPSNWIKANPNLGVSIMLKDLVDEYNQISSLSTEIEFKIKRLGMWVGAANSYFPLKLILDSNEATKPIVKELLAKDPSLKQLKGVFGVDLSSVHDTTSVVVQWEIPQPDNEPIWYFEAMNFIPADLAKRKETVDRVPYQEWANNGYVTLIPGRVIDYEFIINYISSQKSLYNISVLAYDPWQFNIIKQSIIKNNILYEDDVIPVPQGVRMTPIFKEFDRKLCLNKIAFYDNPILIDHTTNVAVKKTNMNDNLLVQKISENQRIDGFMAMLTACSLRQDIDATSKSINPYLIIPGGE